MNKAALKTFATAARRQLMEQVAVEAERLGMTAGHPIAYATHGDYLTIGATQYPMAWRDAVESLSQAWYRHGFAALVEEVAYTWFNRFVAIRYMELHDYLPTHIRVLSSRTPGQVGPDILLHYADLPWPIDVPTLDSAMRAGQRDQVFRQLLIEQCNQLNNTMPFLFEKLNDYTELLLPNHLLHTDSVISRLVRDVSEDDFQEVEVIGWLYQYYIADQKDQVFKGLQAGKKISSEDIPAATQLFTPEWIVRYMVENSVGRLWKESHPEYTPKSPWRYFLDEAEQPPAVHQTLSSLVGPDRQPEEITIMDPACGSGHILVYAFELLYEIYEDAGYPSPDIPRLILENNLYGLEIDGRAAQLAGFALLMKACAYSPRILANPPVPRVVTIKETHTADRDALSELLAAHTAIPQGRLKAWLDGFVNAQTLGSLIRPSVIDGEAIRVALDKITASGMGSLLDHGSQDELALLDHLIRQTELLTQQFDVVVTNPPYMGARGMNPVMGRYLKEYYSEGKADLFAAFMLRCIDMTKPASYMATINQQSWMFLSTYDALRKYLLKHTTTVSMLHLGPRAFEELQGWVVQTTTFVMRASSIADYATTYVRLTEYLPSDEKERRLVQDSADKFYVSQDQFSAIPGSPIAYWATERIRRIFAGNAKLGEMAKVAKGIDTGNNDVFLRAWFEVEYSNIGFGVRTSTEAVHGGQRWFPYNKGGDFRKWYGNQFWVVDWQNDGYRIKTSGAGTIRNKAYFFAESITWTDVSSGKFGVRFSPKGFIFDNSGSSIFCSPKNQLFILAFLSTKVASTLTKYLNPTLHFQVGNMVDLPLALSGEMERMQSLVSDNISSAQEDWDDFETSWSFSCHPLVKYASGISTISSAYSAWADHGDQRFRQMQANEDELNRMFINHYGLEDELTPDVPDGDITLRRADEMRDAKSFLSYFVGCLMGRYSLDDDGLAYAGGAWDQTRYQTFEPVVDGVVLFTDDRYFESDVISRLAAFLTVLYGPDMLEENMQWLAERVDRRTEDDAVTRLRRYFMQEFFKDHCKVYSKRPIYWLFDSGPQKGFRALLYLHRYHPDTIARVRLEYLQPLQRRVAEEMHQLEGRRAALNLSRVERQMIEARLDVLRSRQEECVRYDQVLADLANQQMTLDLDDGVKINYARLQTALAPIK